MARIDFNVVKRQREKQEVHTTEEDNSELSQAYQSVWGFSKEEIKYIELNRLSMFVDKNGEQQPFKLNREKIEQIKLSASDIGIITPLIVRRFDNDYQIISGHHRAVAAKELNILSIPCVVRNVSDEEAYQLVIESNIQRMKMLPSEYGRIFSCYLQKRKDIDMTAQEISDKFGVPKKTMYRYANISKLTEELQNYVDSKVINVDSIDYICNFSEENQNVLCEFIKKTDKKHKITVSLAKKMAQIIENYNNDTVPVHEFTALVVKPEKKSYKNSVYNTVAEKYKIEYSEKELDDIVTKLLEKYFSDKK